MKHRVNVTVDKANDLILSSAGVNISGFVNEIMTREVQRIKAESWKADNRKGMEEVAQFIEQYGSFADENRNW
ncbi:type II toxin-antitoxin system antitoxin CcdA [Photorhabdus luminescens]|uniref:Type II toxin-antitoxin system antitoxin CcdA n=1 Tax=Photorhabdus luminescens subsp. sonorensis TaxID=1173677 RepID=A0A5C4RHS3_PHOLU|nr:type II toxin-antitoxin system antitoxin CcdA [Photorhabdus luminescens]TNH43593.1 type II toxin-antitoxin system antitoxin CcdA [Photorhabdus luminescens subsp. sonorensis]